MKFIYLAQTKRIVGSGDENGDVEEWPEIAWLASLIVLSDPGNEINVFP